MYATVFVLFKTLKKVTLNFDLNKFERNNTINI